MAKCLTEADALSSRNTPAKLLGCLKDQHHGGAKVEVAKVLAPTDSYAFAGAQQLV